MSSAKTGHAAESVTSTSHANKSNSDGWPNRNRDLRRPYHWPLGGVRKFTINPVLPDDVFRFPHNALVNHQYRWYTAPVRSLWRQLFRLPYTLLLLVTILESSKRANDVSYRVSSLYMRTLPILIAMLISATLDMVEDYRRYRMASVLNRRLFVVVDGRNPHFHSVQSQDLRVGQIVRLHNNEEIPADCLLLCSSNSDARAFVSQELITGNENLVKKTAVKETRFEISASAIANISGQVLCNQASVDLEQFYGALRLQAHPRGAALDNRSFICQGSILRRTEWIYCLILFTGPDTKLARARNQINPLTKHQKVSFENTISKVTISIAFLVLSLAFASAVLGRKQKNEVAASYLNPHSDFYLIFVPDHGDSFWNLFLQYIVVYALSISPNVLCFMDILDFLRANITVRKLQRLNRASLAAELRRGGPRRFQHSRADTSDADLQASEAVNVMRSDVLKTLGCVDFLLTDKTGTLTKSQPLKFVFCSVGKRIYGKCYRHKPHKIVGVGGGVFAPAPPKVKVKQCDDLKPSLKKPGDGKTLMSQSISATAVPPSTVGDAGNESGKEQSKKVFRFDVTFQASPTPLESLLSDADTLRSEVSESDSSRTAEGVLSKTLLAKLNRKNFYGSQSAYAFDRINTSLLPKASRKREFILSWQESCEETDWITDDEQIDPSRRVLQSRAESRTRRRVSFEDHTPSPSHGRLRATPTTAPSTSASRHADVSVPRGLSQATPIFASEPFHQAVFNRLSSDSDSGYALPSCRLSDSHPEPTSQDIESGKQAPFLKTVSHDVSRSVSCRMSRSVRSLEDFTTKPWRRRQVALPGNDSKELLTRRKSSLKAVRVETTSKPPQRIRELKERLKQQGCLYTSDRRRAHMWSLLDGSRLHHMARHQSANTSILTGIESLGTMADSEKIVGLDKDLQSQISSRFSDGSGRKRSEFQHSVSHASAKTDDESLFKKRSKKAGRLQRNQPKIEVLSRAEARKRSEGFREGTVEGQDCIDFDDIQILRDLRKGGVRGALIDDFIKGMLLCNSVATDMSLEPYSSVGGPKTSFDDFGVGIVPKPPGSSWDSQLQLPDVEHSVSSVPTPGGDANDFEDMSVATLTQQALLESVQFTSPLPDEVALVYTAYKLGYGLLTKTKKWIVIEINGRYIRYERLFTMDYTENRKRTLVVVRQEGKPGATVYCKAGASSIFDLLDHRDDDDLQTYDLNASTESPYNAYGRSPQHKTKPPKDLGVELRSVTAKHAHKFVMRGFRTLGIAKRKLSALDVEVLLRRVDGLSSCPPAQRDYYCHTLANELESGLEILGVVGLQETLHPGIPKTVSCLTQAGIKIWMLTGDDHERAISTACQAQILRPNMKVLRVELSSSNSMREVALIYDTFKAELDRKRADQGIACFITGADLGNFCASAELETLLLSMLCRCEVVLVCEVSASQKALVARLLRTRLTPTPIILAVGDGLNDIPMFKEAHIAVAVGGRRREDSRTPPNPLLGNARRMERMQQKEDAIFDGILDARLEADVILQSFTDLRPLLFEHGRQSLKASALWLRTSFVTSICQAVPALVFAYSNLASAVPLWSRLGFSVAEAMTVGCLSIMATLTDTEFEPLILWHLPVLYTVSRRKGLLNKTILWLDAVNALIISSCFSVTVREIASGSGSQNSLGALRDSLNILAVYNVLCAMAVSVVFLVHHATSRESIFFYFCAVLLVMASSTAISAPADEPWLLTRFAEMPQRWMAPTEFVRGILVILCLLVGSLITCQSLRVIKLAVSPDVTKLARSFIKQHRVRFFRERQAARDSALVSSVPGNASSHSMLRGKSTALAQPTSEYHRGSTLNHDSSPSHTTFNFTPSFTPLAASAIRGEEAQDSWQPPSFKALKERTKEADAIAFATFVKTVLNPTKVKRVAALLPFPRQFALQQSSRPGGHPAVQLPFTCQVDKVTEACARKHEGSDAETFAPPIEDHDEDTSDSNREIQLSFKKDY
eukprot:Gregarina_sp_Poly_1__4165@NODE_227_length_11180_cov_37_243049_g201_i0_p1_GENE_NODE_227_length_11180_cov_37_243049_g201_i0NODE_227_length_11180_cov_37_243049_g201_i0_p1_ORF_typecomplete_len1973_score253_62E1E2_ATPase/PF00122_20/7_8e21E1E2_ATPase/PF00122_20/26Hydrolase/PF00702_26/3_4Hydrolase/PF00702_26/4_2e19PhoLip_ATPase_C/PF16212_5/5_8e03PhoLip_ATPase_C/PF16212_5/2_6e13Cation_ATPase/PF13246_6/1_1e07Hydrolase_3/PF08282_12/5_5e03Hydrolase_3/PF08282_12/7_2e05S6PP/PF05116_13/5_5e03S6PP/PF05116_13/5